MRFIVLGAGRVGSLVALELSKLYDVSVADKSKESLEPLKQVASILQVDLSRESYLLESIKGFDIVVNALPGSLGYRVLLACIKMRKDLVDISFMPEDPVPLREAIEKAGITVVVDAGFAPGLSNMVVGRIHGELGDLDRVEINVGGLPKEPRPPLYHAVLFSLADLIDEYLRPARIVKDGAVVSIDPLGVIERVRILGFDLERFPTDGLRTMLYTIRAKNMVEYTLRWPGHLERMKVLKELGFFDSKHLSQTLEIIAPHMTYEVADVSIMEVLGETGGESIRYVLYDEASKGHTSMARVTGFTAVEVIKLLMKGSIPSGLVPPELLGVDRKAFEFIVDGLRLKGIKIESLS